MSKLNSFLLLVLFIFIASINAESCRLLIVCHEDYIESIEEFVQWKYETGWKPYILEISSSIGINSYLVKTEITNCIEEMDSPPESILLIGSDSNIRMGYINSATSDAYYADLDSDNRTEIPIGRFPGYTTSDIRSLIAKTMHYAQDPEVLMDYSWLKNATLLYSGSDSHYSDFMTELSSVLEDNDYYVNLHVSSEPGAAGQAVEELNEGIGYIIFRGSGVEGWSGFYITPSELRNGSYTPIVSGTTCATIGRYGPSWVNAGTEENFKGGVIYIGSNTVSSGHDLMMQRSAMAEGFYLGFLNGMTTGQSTENGRQFVLDYGGSACEREYASLNMMGDPTIWVWSDIPHEIDVDHYPFYIIGDADFYIEVNFEDEPVESALCCISIGDRLCEWGYTNSDGNIDLEYSFLGDGTDSMLISVVGHNLKPYREKAACRVDGPRPYILNSWMDDSETGNDDDHLSRNEICNIEILVRNIGASECGEIIGKFTTDSPNITIIDSIVIIPSLDSDTEIIPEDCFQFQVNEDAPVGEDIEYAITLYHDTSEYETTWNTPAIVGAGIEYTEISIDDAEPWGNNNLYLDFGENASLNIEVLNNGDANAHDLFLRVSCTTDELLFPYERSYLRFLGSGTRHYMMPIPIICNPNNIIDSIAEVILEIEAIDGGYTRFTQTDTIEIEYRNASAFVTGPDSYGYFIYDKNDIFSRRNPIYTWTELSEIGYRNRRLSSSSNGVETVALPFNFRYYGLEYSEITITTEGYITAGNTYTCESSPDNIPFPPYSYPTIAAAWNDLNPVISGNIYTYFEEENGKFHIQYDYITDSECKISTFEITICDNEIYPTPTGDNEIYFYFQDSILSSNKVVGIQNQFASSGLCYLNNGEYSVSAEEIIPESVLRITTYPPEPESEVFLHSINTSPTDYYGGDGDGRYEEDETIDIIVTLMNLGELNAENIKIFLTTNDDRANIEIISDTLYLEELNAGLRRTLPENLQFTFNSLHYDIDAVFNIHIISNDGDYTSTQPLFIPLREQLYIEDTHPRDYNMETAYPNPFNSSINFELPSAHSTIEIYSTNGKLLEKHTPGANTYKLDWYSSKYSTGIYLYRIISDNNECFGKILFIK